MPIGTKPRSNQIDSFLKKGLSREDAQGVVEQSTLAKEKPVIVRLPSALAELVSRALQISREDNPKQSQHQWILAALSKEAKRQIKEKEELDI
jgi:hypothetical protein